MKIFLARFARLVFFNLFKILCFCLFCGFTSQVNSYGHGRMVSSPNHTFSCGSLNKQLTSTFCTYIRLYWQQPFLNDSAEGRRMTVEIISWSIFTRVWNLAVIELAAPGSAVRLASVARHVTDWATQPGNIKILWEETTCSDFNTSFISFSQ